MSEPLACNLVNVGVYKSGVQVQGYGGRACNDSITWTGGESGTVYTYNVYFLEVDGNPAIETKSGTFTTPFCTPVSVSSCSASSATANIGENVTWTATPANGLAPTTPKQEWIGNTANGGWAAPPGGDTAILARRFQATENYNLKVVSLDIAKESTVTGTLWVTIESDAGGVPSGSVLPNGTSPTITETQVSTYTSYGWTAFYLNNVQLVAGTDYWIVLRGSLSGPGNKIIAMDTTAADPNPGSLSLIHSWGAPAWTNTGASYGYRIYAPTYTYSWSGDAPLGGQTVNPVTVQYPTDGSKSGSVTVSDGVSNASALCGTVTVNPVVPPTCFVDPSSVSTRQNTTATGSGGSGSYTWSGGENPATGSGPTFTTNYTTEGSKTITITGGGSNTCPVTVYQPTLVIDPPSVSVQVSNTAPLAALYDADGPGGPSGNTAVTSSATWSSDSPGIATVNASGVVTGVSSGSTIIRAAYTDSFGNALTATADVTVSTLPNLVANAISLSGTLIAGNPLTFTNTVTNSGGSIAGASTGRYCLDVSEASCLSSATGQLSTPAIGSLNPSQTSGTFTQTWTATAGSHTMVFCADVSNVVSESDESAGSNCESNGFIIGAQTLSVGLTASPNSQPAPLNTNLTATVSGSALGTINYTFWWNCTNTSSDVSYVGQSSVCGDPTNSAIGAKFNGEAATSKSVGHTYLQNATAKVIVERGSAPAAQDQEAIVVSLVAACSVAPSSAPVGNPVTWNASATGGDGSYVYSWSGSDGLSCSGQPSPFCYAVTKVYLSIGSKNGTVTVTSASQSDTKLCGTVNITPGTSISATPPSILPGGFADLSWDSTGFDNSDCTIDQGIGAVTADGTRPVSPVMSTLYTITCNDGVNSDSASAAVNVAGTPTIREIPPN